MRSIILACLALFCGSALAEPVFTNVRPTTCVPDIARRDTARIGDLNPNLFSATSLETETEDSGPLAAQKDLSTATEWIGVLPKKGTMVFTKRADVVTGSINEYGRTWEIYPNCGGYVLYEIDPAAIPPFEDDGAPNPGRIPQADVEEITVRGTTIHDVLVFYTQKAEATWTLPTLNSRVDTAFTNTNKWLSQSGSDQTFVRTGPFLQSPVQEAATGGMKATWDAFRESPQAKALRDQYKADEMVLISNDSGGYSGYGGLWWYCCTSSGGLTGVESWAVVNSNHLPNRTLAHELGHTNGLDHDRANAGSTSAGYHYGYRVCAADGSGFRDIMSYACGGGIKAPLINYYSNPSLTYNGQPIGIRYATDPANASENVRALMENGPKIAAFRNPPSQTPPPNPPPAPIPATPVNLIATLQNGAVVLTWGYPDNQATSATVSRATKNPNNGKWSGYTVRGSVTAPTNNFTDRPPAGTYRYVVKAVNNSGSSPNSGPQAIVVP